MMNKLRENGNDEFKKGNFDLAVQYYTDAIASIVDMGSMSREELDKAIKADDCLQKCLNNRSQCYLKLARYDEAIEDATNILRAVPDDIKALFRRSQAYKELKRFEDSLMDAKRLLSIDPVNKPCLELMQTLTKMLQDKANEQRSTKSQVKNMLELTKNEKGEKKTTALNNLIVLSREEAGSNEILASNGLDTLREILKQPDCNTEIKLGVTRIFSSLCKGSFSRVSFNSLYLFFLSIFLFINGNFFLRPKQFSMIFKPI